MNRDWEQRLVNVRFAPQKRTFVSALSMSALCQKQTPISVRFDPFGALCRGGYA
jgi:hypothetical protein